MSNSTNEVPKLLVRPKKELKFIGPFSRPAKAAIQLSNRSEKLILFKIKTNAPQRYYAKPNSGMVPPYSFVLIEVILLPIPEDVLFLLQDKVLVESALGPPNYDGNFRDAWNEVEKSKFSIYKLKCSPHLDPSPLCCGKFKFPANFSMPEDQLTEELFFPLTTAQRSLNEESPCLDVAAINEEESRADGLEITNMGKIKAENLSLKEDVLTRDLSKERSVSSMPKTNKLFLGVSCLSFSILFALSATAVLALVGDLMEWFKTD